MAWYPCRNIDCFEATLSSYRESKDGVGGCLLARERFCATKVRWQADAVQNSQPALLLCTRSPHGLGNANYRRSRGSPDCGQTFLHPPGAARPIACAGALCSSKPPSLQRGSTVDAACLPQCNAEYGTSILEGCDFCVFTQTHFDVRGGSVERNPKKYSAYSSSSSS